MKTSVILVAILGVLAVASSTPAQNIGMAFDEAGTLLCIDGHTDLVLDPDLFNLPSANVWVIAYDIPQLFGYEYNLTSTEATGLASTPVIWPVEGSNFATLPGDVRVGTGICFAAGDAQAGPDPAHIRLAKHQFTWITLPTVDVRYCINPSTASVQATGATAPQYTECVSDPVSLPFGMQNSYEGGIYFPQGCVFVLFDPEPGSENPATCLDVVLATHDQSWGALKAAY